MAELYCRESVWKLDHTAFELVQYVAEVNGSEYDIDGMYDR